MSKILKQLAMDNVAIVRKKQDELLKKREDLQKIQESIPLGEYEKHDEVRKQLKDLDKILDKYRYGLGEVNG